MMKAVDILKAADGTQFEDEDGEVEELKLLPPLGNEELNQLESQLPCPLPEDVRQLLGYCRGFEGVLESIDFSGGLCAGFEMKEIFPHAIPIAHDGFGNYWIVDLTKESTTWGPIFFACHDAPVIVFQTESLAHFIGEVIRFGNRPWESEIDDVHEKHHLRIWKENPGMLSIAQCIDSGDRDLVTFAQSLGEGFLICDLRNPQMGDGFSWGRYGPRTVLKRFGDKRIFAYQVRTSLWQRIFRNR
jgi:cell wall assembly regulator SMI1